MRRQGGVQRGRERRRERERKKQRKREREIIVGVDAVGAKKFGVGHRPRWESIRSKWRSLILFTLFKCTLHSRNFLWCILFLKVLNTSGAKADHLFRVRDFGLGAGQVILQFRNKIRLKLPLGVALGRPMLGNWSALAPFGQV